MVADEVALYMAYLAGSFKAAVVCFTQEADISLASVLVTAVIVVFAAFVLLWQPTLCCIVAKLVAVVAADLVLVSLLSILAVLAVLL